MKHLPNITESEWLIMNALWDKSPLIAVEIVERVRLEKHLEDTTIKTLLRRLIAKKAVDFTIDEKNAKLYHYFPLVTREDCVLKESKHFLSLYYKNDMPKLFSTFVENADIAEEELENLIHMLEQKRDSHHD